MRVLLTLILITFTSLVSAADSSYPESFIEEIKSELNKSIEIDLSKIKAGNLVRAKWGGRVVYIYKRTLEDISTVKSSDADLFADPSDSHILESIKQSHFSTISGPWAQMYTKALKLNTNKIFRSISEKYLVVEGTGPHSMCDLMFLSKNAGEKEIFFDPCSNTSFDATGKIFKGIAKRVSGDEAAKYNLRLVPHHFKSSDTLVIGIEGGHSSLPSYHFDHKALYQDLSPSDRLIIAARYNDHAMIHATLKEGINLYRPIGKGTYMHAAIVGSSTDIIELLLNIGIPPKPTDIDMAHMLGRKDVVKMLMRKQGAN